MKKSTLLVCFLLVGQALVFAQTPASKTYAFKNGNWFTGSGFAPGTWYSANGTLTQKAPVKIDSVIDLENRWVIPPSGDAFSAFPAAGTGSSILLENYWQEGVFYLQVLSNSQADRKAIEYQVNQTKTPEAIFANGGLTCTLGKPFLEYEAPANNIRNPSLWKDRYESIRNERKMAGDGYWFISDKKALDDSWEKLKAQKPGIISIYLLDEANNGGKPGYGLTADMAKAVIKKAHKADLRVYAHVETAEDVRLGLKIGVDGFANVPGHKWDGKSDLSKYELSDDDLKKLAKKKIPVVALLSQGQSASREQKTVQEFHAKTLRRMFGYDVHLVAGSDDIQRTIRTELNYWFSLGGLNHVKALQSLCEYTPAAIFPNRKIGKIAEGYEASFIVLREDPSANILKMRMQAFKVKNGNIYK